MKKSAVFLLAALSFLLLQVTSCGKLDNIVPELPSADMKYCNISKMLVKSAGYSEMRTYDFIYNSVGNPVKAITSAPALTLPNYYFVYGEKGRLTEVIMPYFKSDTLPAQFAFERWIKYTYGKNSKNMQPIADTLHYMGYYENGMIRRCSSCPPKTVTNYEYDSKGRVSKTTSEFNGNVSVVEYRYDTKGNLVRPASYVYDDKINIHRTNEVWMLIDKDYSRNNPVAADSYNNYGLPQTAKSIKFLYWDPFVNATFSYICDAK